MLVTQRLIDSMENENRFSLENFQHITSLSLLQEDNVIQIQSPKSKLPVHHEPDTSNNDQSEQKSEIESDLQLKTSWKRGAGSVIDTSSSSSKGREKKGILNVDILRKKEKQKVDRVKQFTKKTGKLAIGKSELIRRASHSSLNVAGTAKNNNFDSESDDNIATTSEED